MWAGNLYLGTLEMIERILVPELVIRLPVIESINRKHGVRLALDKQRSSR